MLSDDDTLPVNNELVSLTAEELDQLRSYRYMRVAQYREAEAAYDAAAAKRRLLNEENNLRSSELYLNRARNANRPSMMVSAVITAEEAPNGRTIYTATGAGMSAQGDSPDLAFQAFDEMWIGKNRYE